MAETFGLKRTLEDEKMFNGVGVEFASVSWDTPTTIASTRGKLYKICLQMNSTSKKNAKQVLSTVVKYINITLTTLLTIEMFFMERHLLNLL